MAESRTAASAPAIVRDGADASPLLGRLVLEWGDVFREEVLKKWLDPTDLALLARACWKCGEAVASANLVRVGVPSLRFSRPASCWLGPRRTDARGGSMCAAKYGQVEGR
jgi:hypothetical protein